MNNLPVFDGKFRNRFQSQKRGGHRFGRGNVLSKVSDRADKITKRVKGRKPNIIPSVEEALGKWNVGSRITEMLPTALKNDTKSDKPLLKRRQEEKLSKQSGADISL